MAWFRHQKGLLLIYCTDFLRVYGIIPLDRRVLAQQEMSQPQLGDKRSAAVMGDDEDEEDNSRCYYPGTPENSSPTTPVHHHYIHQPYTHIGKVSQGNVFQQ